MSRNPYVRPVSKTGWWLKHPRYMRYMSREVTCVFIGALGMLMVWGLKCLSEGPAAYGAFLSSLKSPLGVLMLVLILGFSVHNATSWFNVTPKAMPVQIGEDFLAGKYIVGAHYAVWLLASLVVLLMAGVF